MARKKSLNHMDRHPENNKETVKYDERFNDYSIAVSKNTIQQIYFCPWCGKALPKSLRDKWFDELEALGIDPMNDEIPEKYRTARWRQK